MIKAFIPRKEVFPIHAYTAAQIKALGLFTMTVDHTAKIFLPQLLPALGDILSLPPQTVLPLVTLFSGMGSMTIFFFLWFCAEGCRHTHSMPRYLGRLLFWGCLSELPFQWMVSLILQRPFAPDLGFTNVMATLFLGAAACKGYALLKGKGLPAFLPPIAAGLLAIFLGTDYSVFGVLGVFLCFYYEDPAARLKALGAVIVLSRGIVFPMQAVLSQGMAALPTQLVIFAWALCALPILARYSGQKGRSLQLGFYLYYPLHMTFLCILAAVL